MTSPASSARVLVDVLPTRAPHLDCLIIRFPYIPSFDFLMPVVCADSPVGCNDMLRLLSPQHWSHGKEPVFLAGRPSFPFSPRLMMNLQWPALEIATLSTPPSLEQIARVVLIANGLQVLAEGPSQTHRQSLPRLLAAYFVGERCGLVGVSTVLQAIERLRSASYANQMFYHDCMSEAALLTKPLPVSST